MNQPIVQSFPGLGRIRAVFAAFALVPLFGCVTQVQSPVVAVAPALSVEAFLQASNARDFDTMARLFGSENGPVSETGSTFGCAFRRVGSWIGLGQRCVRREEVELRMATISDILRYQDYRIVSERLEPGRRYTTNRIGVDLTRGGNVVRDVPFLVVRSKQGRWLVQEIDLQRLTGIER